MESRLDQLYRLKKKYGSTVEEMLDYLQNCREELDQIQYSSDTHRQLERKLSRPLRRRRPAVPGPENRGPVPGAANSKGAGGPGYAQGAF